MRNEMQGTDLALVVQGSTSDQSMSARKRAIRDASEKLAPDIDKWHQRNRYFHDKDARYLQFLIRLELRVLDLGCGNGDLLSRLRPAEGIGVDFSPAMVAVAKNRYPHLQFIVGDIENAETIRLLGPRPSIPAFFHQAVSSPERWTS
jgi:SAM-dependent methyltransferase